MATIERLTDALRNADAAGDTQAAQTIAAEIRRMQATPAAAPAPAAEAPTPLVSTDRRPLQERVDSMGTLGGAMVGSAENMLNLASSAVAAPVAGWAGIFGGDVRKVQNAMTYEPRTRQGQAASEVTGAIPQLYAKGVGAAADAVRGNDSGGLRDFAGTTLDVLGQAVPVIYGAKAPLTQMANRQLLPPSPNQALFQQARERGLVVNPLDVQRGGVLQQVAGAEAGASALNAEASLRNAPKVQEILAKDIGLPGAPINAAALQTVREQAGRAYDAVGTVPFNFTPTRKFADTMLAIEAEQRQLTTNSRSAGALGVASDMNEVLQAGEMTPAAALKNWREMNSKGQANAVSPDPILKDLGRAQKRAAAAYAEMMDQNMVENGMGHLVPELQAARTTIAKAWDLQKSLVGQGNEVSALDLGRIETRARDAGKQRMSGEQKVVANLGQEFPKSFAPTVGLNKQPFSAWDIARALHSPRMAAMEAARPVARSMLLSDAYQNSLLKPQYAPLDYGVMAPGYFASLLAQQDQTK